MAESVCDPFASPVCASASNFSPISAAVNFASAQKPTGGSRKIQDCCADLYNYVQKWNNCTTEGYAKLKAAASILIEKISDKESISDGLLKPKSDSHEIRVFQELQTLMKDLGDIIEEMRLITDKMERIVSQLKHLKELARHQKMDTSLDSQDHSDLMQEWRISQLYEKAEEIVPMYRQEFSLKEDIAQKFCHVQETHAIKYLLTSWAFEPYINCNCKSLLLSMVIECGLKRS